MWASFIGCNNETSGADADQDGTGNGSGNGSEMTTTATGAVSGTVRSNLEDTSTGSAGSAANFRKSAKAQNTCDDATFEVFLVGGEGEAIAQGTATGGSFDIDYEQDVAIEDEAEATDAVVDEIMLVFSCGSETQVRCYGQPGEASLVCDPVSNALVLALEEAVGADVTKNKIYQGLSISRIAAGMAETLRLTASIDPNNDIIAKILSGASKQAIAEAIMESPVGAMLDSLAALAQETKIQNEVGEGEEAQENLGNALAELWTVERVVNQLVGLGAQITLSLNEEDGEGTAPYGGLANLIEAITARGFFPQMRAFLSQHYDRLYGVQPILRPLVMMTCVVENYGPVSVPDVRYPPSVAGEVEGEDGINRLTCRGISAQDAGVVASNGDLAEGFGAPHLVLEPPQKEANRNDIDGSHANERDFRVEIGLVDVFPEIQRALEPGGACSDIEGLTDDAPPPPETYDFIGPCFRENGLDAYFSGLLGVWRFLTDPKMRDVRVSFDDLHRGLVDRSGLRLATRGVFGDDGRPIHITDASEDESSYAWVPILLRDAEREEDGLPVLDLLCPDILCQDGDLKDFVETTRAQFDTMVEDFRPGFELVFGDLANIPDAQQLRRSIFTASHHQDHNIAGSRFFWVVGKDTSSPPDYRADVPILCAFRDSEDRITREWRDGNRVDCRIADGIWQDGVGQNGSQDYSAFYGLRDIGSADRNYYNLVNLDTGEDYYRRGRPFRIRGIASSSEEDADEGDGRTLRATDSSTCSVFEGPNGEQFNECYVDAFDYVAVRFPNRNDDASVGDLESFFPQESYQPYSMQVAVQRSRDDGGIEDFYLQIALAEGPDAQSREDDYPVCLKAQGIVRSELDPNVATEINLAGNLGNCFGDVEDIFDPNSPIFDDQDPRDNLPPGIDPDGENDDPFRDDPTNSGDNEDPLGDNPPPPIPGEGDGDIPPTVGDIPPPVDRPELYYLELAYQNTTTAAEYLFNVVGQDGHPIYKEVKTCGPFQNEPCIVQITLAEIEDALGDTVGPTGIKPYLLGYEIANRRYDSRFDPFCIDTDGDRACDCYRDTDGSDGNAEIHLTATSQPSASECTLEDRGGDEPTFPDAPIWSDDPNAGSFWRIIEACGDLAGNALKDCLADVRNSGHDIERIYADWRRLFTCADASKKLDWVDIPRLLSEEHLMTGGGCGSEENGFMGPVRLLRIISRDNAFDIERPQTFLNMVSRATASTGVGVTVPKEKKIFNFMEALAMTYVRLVLPIRAQVYGPDRSGGIFDPESGRFELGNANDTASFVPYSGFPVFFRQIEGLDRDNDNDLPSTTLRTFLEEAARLNEAAAAQTPAP